jgi:hypothetical protein
MNDPSPLADLMVEYERALHYTDVLIDGLGDDELVWRPVPESSAIAWHLGHQAAVAHYMIRNLTAAEPPIDSAMDAVMDSATAEVDRASLPPMEMIRSYRATVADRVRFRITNINEGRVGAPAQLRRIATTMLTSIVNHEYQHDQWIAEVRTGPLGRSTPPRPVSPLLTESDGYVILA